MKHKFSKKLVIILLLLVAGLAFGATISLDSPTRFPVDI